MGETSNIQWTDATFNPWIGCTKIDDQCDNCYAAAGNNLRKWNGGTWGPGAPRHVTSESNWLLPYKWDAEAREKGIRIKVFSASLADIFDAEAPTWPWGRRVRLGYPMNPGDKYCIPPQSENTRDVFFKSIVAQTANIDWIVLTKRYERAEAYFSGLPRFHPHRRIWLLFSAGTQERAERAIEILSRIQVAVTGISAEPLLERIDISTQLARPGRPDWVITGGESGPRARPLNLAWTRALRDQCQQAGVAYFFKQGGAKPFGFEWPAGTRFRFEEAARFANLRDRKGGDLTELPADLRVRMFPGERWS